jgi:hypothetical protein
MSRFSLLLVSGLVAAGLIGCTQCDTCDDFPTPCTGPNCGYQGPPGMPGGYPPVSTGPMAPGPADVAPPPAAPSSAPPSSAPPAGAPAPPPLPDTNPSPPANPVNPNP